MAVPVARVHLKMAHAALPALLPTPPKWKMLSSLLPTPCVAANLPKPPLAKRGRADADERWDAHKTKSASATSAPPKPGPADSPERWDAHKKAASPASSSSSSGTSSIASSSKWTISRASSAERWNVHKMGCPELLDDGENSSIGSNDVDAEEEEEIVWKPRAMYAGPGFVVAAPQASTIPMPTSFLVSVA